MGERRVVKMKRIKLAAATLVMFVGFCFQARAEPGPVVEYLMGTPVSLFSFGMYRLTEDVRLLNSQHPAFFTAGYDWDANRIIVSAFSVNRDFAATKENCSSLINAMRTNGLINVETGQPFEGFKNSRYGDLFDPIGFARKDAPAQHLDKIDEIIELKAIIRKDDSHISCEGPLLSRKILVDSGK
jgi:hypothetical protein